MIIYIIDFSKIMYMEDFSKKKKKILEKMDPAGDADHSF